MRSRLKELRIRAGMTQVELADKAGLTQSTVSKIELGRGDGDAATLRALASAHPRGRLAVDAGAGVARPQVPPGATSSVHSAVGKRAPYAYSG